MDKFISFALWINKDSLDREGDESNALLQFDHNGVVIDVLYDKLNMSWADKYLHKTIEHMDKIQFSLTISSLGEQEPGYHYTCKYTPLKETDLIANYSLVLMTRKAELDQAAHESSAEQYPQ